MAFASSSRESHVLPHIAIFPFMAKGHTIPLIQLAHHLRRRRLATVTFLTTHGNAAFVRERLSGADDTAVVELAFPAGVSGIPPAVESAEALTSMASLAAFAHAASLLQPQLEASLAAMEPPASLLVADAFLYWTNASAATLGVPKASFLGISAFAQVMRELRVSHDPVPALLHAGVDGDGNPATFTVPEFPHIKLTLEDLMAPLGDPSSAAPMMELHGKLAKAIEESHGLIVNTFQGLEKPYMEFWNNHYRPRAWAVGPLCLSQPASSSPGAAGARPSWMEWLDEKAAAGRGVLYVAFGTLAAIPEVQLKEVADGLERAEVDFIWAVRPENVHLGAGFEERTKGRGLVVREWVDQLGILQHQSVRGFLSHCGWNSVLESVAAAVPLAAWPMQADQPLNAVFAVHELKIAVRVHTSDRTMRGPVTSEEISRVVRELMLGEAGTEAAKNVAELSVLAMESILARGSSWKAVEEMIDELCAPNMCAKVEASKEESRDV
ncbi:UDP-glycosyltransferase 90A1-like [Triticum dicoccoides]|uniref:UDP-glycosyltransferase 90A1-like n=1 Tax=Triticum dicoccoides TaxID=85692 RepID=UPI00188FFF85|nr:UDP-glycosyltransferase 90A1-like [Triticum dicoccoides]